MLFIHTFEKVLDGSRVATSRIVKPGDDTTILWTDEHAKYGVVQPHDESHYIVPVAMPYWLAEKSQIQRVMNGERTVYQVGKDYAVQPGRGQKAVGRIRITGIERYDVRTITAERAKAEGFDTLEGGIFAFWYVWCAMHDPEHKVSCAIEVGYKSKLRGWRVETYAEALARLMERPAAFYDAWFLTFELLKGGE